MTAEYEKRETEDLMEEEAALRSANTAHIARFLPRYLADPDAIELADEGDYMVTDLIGTSRTADLGEFLRAYLAHDNGTALYYFVSQAAAAPDQLQPAVWRALAPEVGLTLHAEVPRVEELVPLLKRSLTSAKRSVARYFAADLALQYMFSSMNGKVFDHFQGMARAEELTLDGLQFGAPADAVEMMQLAAAWGHREAALALANMYQAGHKGHIPADPVVATAWYVRAGQIPVTEQASDHYLPDRELPWTVSLGWMDRALLEKLISIAPHLADMIKSIALDTPRRQLPHLPDRVEKDACGYPPPLA